MSEVSRRRFLAGGLATAGAAAGLPAAAAACGSDGPGGPAAAAADPRYLRFRGPHQTGITHPGNQQGLMAAFTVTAADRSELRDTFAALTGEIERLMSGEPYEDRDPAFPPLYTGAVGNPPPPSDLSVVVSVGASLFDDRFGLADRRPSALEQMPFLANDRLDPARSHGDLLLTLTSAHEDLNLFALRQIHRATRGTLALHWMLDGYNRRSAADTRPGGAGQRNLMGFIDGTANLDTTDGGVMDRYVWVDPDDGEPDWAAGGSYHVVRVIRMLVEFWDRTRLSEQEAIIGRRKDTGAPFSGSVETDIPEYGDDPDGDVTSLDAHIRLANPRTAATSVDLILRAGLNFSRGFDAAGQLDQGLAFVSYQRRLSQFLNTQARLAGEPLEEYIRPEGGGFYFALPGVERGGDILGGALLA
ncbi:MAG TPA: Dyp-type peroxidase [Acidimicrobiales bacterium]